MPADPHWNQSLAFISVPDDAAAADLNIAADLVGRCVQFATSPTSNRRGVFLAMQSTLLDVFDEWQHTGVAPLPVPPAAPKAERRHGEVAFVAGRYDGTPRQWIAGAINVLIATGLFQPAAIIAHVQYFAWLAIQEHDDHQAHPRRQ